MKKIAVSLCILSLLLFAALALCAAADEGDVDLDVSSLFPFAMRTTFDGTQYTTVTENAPQGAVVIAAAYKDGRLAETKVLGAAGGTYTFAEGYDTVKVFALDGETLKPVSEAENVVIE